MTPLGQDPLALQMLDGVAYCQIILEQFAPVDFVYLDVNPAFSRLTGLGNVVGKRASEVLPGFPESDWDVLQAYGRVALGGTPERFETYLKSLDTWFEVSVFSPQMGYFIAQFDNISRRKRAEQLLTRLRGLYQTLREVNRTMVRVQDEEELYQTVCDVTVRYGAADAAWVGLVQAGTPGLRSAAVAGIPKDTIPDTSLFGSRTAVPLVCRGERIGDLTLLAVLLDVFQSKDEADVLEQLGTDLRFALESLQTRREKAEMEAVARKSGSLLRTIFEGVSDAFVFSGPDRKVQLVNTAFERLFGYPPDDIVGRTTQFLYANPEQYVREIPVSGLRLDGHFRRSDDSTFWAEISVSPIIDPEGRSLGYFAAIRDATERRQVLADLEASQARYQVVAENMTDVIWTVDVESQAFTYISPSVQKQTGYTVAEAMAVEAEKRLLPEQVEASEERFRQRLQSWQEGARITYLDELEQVRKDGSRMWVEISTRFGQNPMTGRLEVYGVTRDITERKRLWGQLLQAQKLESLGTLSAGIAHDFNNLLSVILSTVYLAEMSPVEPESYAKRLGSIKKAALRGAALVKQLLVIGRKSELQLASVDLNEVVREVARILVETFPKTIDIRYDLGDVALLMADETQLHQVVLNLCVNAKDAMPQGGSLVLKTRPQKGTALRHHETRATAEEYACLEVMDSGTGIESSTQARIFEPFFTTKDRGKGSGLGLTMAVGILEGHRGWIQLDSAPGRGSTFRCFLPAPDPAPRHRSDASAKPRQTRVPGGKVLLVEDEAEIREALQEVLQSAGYEVLTASDGQVGWESFQKQPEDIHLVVTDQGLPYLSGTELLSRIHQTRPQVPVILLSGSFSPDELTELNGHSGSAALRKPFAPDDLVETASRLLQRPRFC